MLRIRERARRSVRWMTGRSRRSSDAHVRGTISPFFDAEYYLGCDPDVASARVDPLDHFTSSGSRERRNPHPGFDTGSYLDTDPSVSEPGVNPLYHYVVIGATEERLIQPPSLIPAERRAPASV